MMSSLGQENGPPDLVLKLAFQFLSWKDNCIYVREQIFNSVDLVCKRWKRLIDEHDVGRQLCINQISVYDDFVSIRNKNLRAQAESIGGEYTEEKWFDPRHEVLATMVKLRPPEGRTFKDMFMLSELTGNFILLHKLDGPDILIDNWGGRREKTLREKCLHDCRWTVMPTIEKLRQVFNDPKKNERKQDVIKMKQRLLTYARSKGRASLDREEPTRMEKEALLDIAGKYFMMLAVRNSLDENIFNCSSGVSVTLGEIIKGIESLTGKEIAADVSVRLKKTSTGIEREFSFSPGSNKSEWPMSPVDCLSLLIREFWLTKSKVEDALDDARDCTDEEWYGARGITEEEWYDAIKNWWLALAEPMRQLLLATYNQMVKRFTNVEPLPSDLKSSLDVPTKTLKLLLETIYPQGRKELAVLIFRDLNPTLRDDLFKIYHQQAQAYSAAIRQSYHSVYSEDDTLEHNAKILLDIFLEVPCFDNEPKHPTAPLTSENCDELLARMEAAMNSWNELIDRATSEDVFWSPGTIIELSSFQQMWGHRDHGKSDFVTETATARQYCVPHMVRGYLYRILGTNQQLRYYGSIEKDAENLFKEIMSSQRDSSCIDFHQEISHRTFNLVNDFRALSIYTNTREHAMMALVPLLSNLSQCDSKRLIYALFIDRHGSDWSGHGFRGGLSELHFGCMYIKNIPCAVGECLDSVYSLMGNELSLFTSDMLQISKWTNDCYQPFLNENSILRRLFCVPLPSNIISAMGEFMVENLYQNNINDVDTSKLGNAIEVKPFLVRYCSENPDSTNLVWPYLRRAIENSILAVEGLDPGDVDEKQRSIFETMTLILVNCCIASRAKSLIPLLTRLEDTQAIVLPELINVENLADRFEQAPSVHIDTKEYFNIRYDDNETL